MTRLKQYPTSTNVIFFEAADARLQGYSFMLFAPKGGLGYLEDELGLAKEIESISFEPLGFQFVDAATGDLLMRFNSQSYSYSGNAKARRVMRSKLRSLLLEVAQREGVQLIWNARILRCEQPIESSVVKVFFENGDAQEFDLIIGGMHLEVH